MEKILLENGARVLLIPMDDARSASVNIWVTAGSRHEEAGEEGISHFIEHMLFKGTPTRTSRQISEEMDMLGGALNAYTSKEYTRYYVHTLGESATRGLDLLCDMVLNSTLEEKELETEKGVVLDEIAMYEDSGEDVAHEKLALAVWQDNPLGRPIAGTKDSVSGFTRDDLKNYLGKHYVPERMVVVVAGQFDRSEILDKINRTIGALENTNGGVSFAVPEFASNICLSKKDFEQTSLVLAFPGIAVGDERRYAMSILNYIIGGGSSSRLFQRLREELGLAYSVYSSNYAATGAGLFTITISFSGGQQKLVLDELDVLIQKITDGITEKEFERARVQIKSSYILGLEGVSSIASFAGRNEIYDDTDSDINELLRRIDAVSIDDVNRLAKNLFESRPRAISVAGEILDEDFYKAYI